MTENIEQTIEEWNSMTESEKFERHNGLALMEAGGYLRPCDSNMPLEDTEQYSRCCFGLLSAIRTWDPCRGTSFATYARRCMRSELGNWAKLVQHRVGAINLVSEGTPMLEVFVEDRPEPWQEYARMEEELEAKRGMLGLSDREEATLFGILAGVPMRDMVNEWGVSRQRVDQYKRNAFARIRELYPEGF